MGALIQGNFCWNKSTHSEYGLFSSCFPPSWNSFKRQIAPKRLWDVKAKPWPAWLHAELHFESQIPLESSKEIPRGIHVHSDPEEVSETPMSQCLFGSGPVPGPLLWVSQAHRSTRAEMWKFSSVAAPPLQGTGNSAQEFQGRAQFGYSSSPLVASNGFNLQLEPPGINKGDVNLPLLTLSPVIWFPLMCRNLSL